MNRAAVDDPAVWRPSSFEADVERRPDGTLILTPRAQLPPCPPRITDPLEHWAHLVPERLFAAQRAADGHWRQLSYGEALARVQALAAGLASFELSAERPLLILSGNGIEHLLLALAAMYVGVPYCAVSPAYSHARSDLARLSFVMRLLTPGMIAAFAGAASADAPPDAVALEGAAFRRAIALTAPPDARLLGDVPLAGDRDTLTPAHLEAAGAAADAAARSRALHERVGADSIAKFLLTSGSTGDPKAVVTTHRMLCSNQWMLRAALPFIAEEPPVLVDWLPWHHTFGGSHNVGLVLVNGGSLYIDAGRPAPGQFEPTLRNLREISPTLYLNVPRGFDLLAEQLAREPALRARFYRRLRACFFAGASLSQGTWDALERLAIASRGRRVPMISGLGATEAGPSVTFTTPDTERAGVIGLPPPGCIVKLAPVGDKLEMRTRGPHVMPGYWRAPGQSAAAFDEEGFYRLGDAVRLRDPLHPTRGLIFDGRLAEDFKLASGTWVSVSTLRASLLKALAPLALDVVIAGPDRDYLTLLVLPDRTAACEAMGAPGGELSLDELARDARLQQRIAAALGQHAQAQLGSASRVRRALILSEPPSLDRGEITEKGTLNQRRMLERWAHRVAELYREPPPAPVICVAEQGEST